MIRSDGSVQSAHAPTWDNRYQVRDYGIYRGVVREILYSDNERNDSDSNEVVYTVVIVGGDRDGQIFSNARIIKTLGGFANYEEVILKATGGITNLDPADPLALGDPSVNQFNTLNGDVVYVQFLNGDPHLPIIVGLGYHQSRAEAEATEDDGPRFRRNYNGISTEITKDGEFTWTKDNGSFVPFLPNSADPLTPFVNQFAPLPGQEQAVQVTLDNQYLLTLAMMPGLTALIDGLKDNYSFATAAGATVTLDGIADNFAVSTAVGTALTVDGVSDSLEFASAAGASVKIDGLGDSISLADALGDSISVSASDGIQAATTSGASLSMKDGEVMLGSIGQAQLVLDKTGFVKLGNASGDVLKDVLLELIKALTTEAPAGFGAPLVGLPTYIQLLAKIMLITGG